jgi:hypothetical protein
VSAVQEDGQAGTIARPTSGKGIESSARQGAVDKQRTSPPWKILVAVLFIVLITMGLYWRSHPSAKLTEKDTIVLADFSNTTGDTVFDGALRRGLSVQLEQSPFLSLVSEEQTQQTLRFMGKDGDARITPEIAREVCQRTSSKAELEGSIALVGTQYNLILRAVDCSNDKLLTSTQALASDKSLTLWKDADPDIPILKQAKAEYAKLQ